VSNITNIRLINYARMPDINLSYDRSLGPMSGANSGSGAGLELDQRLTVNPETWFDIQGFDSSRE